MTLDVVPETSLQENSQTKNSRNKQIKIQVRKANNAKYSKNKTSLVQSPFTTLGQETRWAYSTTLPSPHGV